MPLRADRLKQRRQFKGFTQQDLADQLRVSQQQVARWERGTSDASADSVAQLARALDCTTDWLLGLVEQTHGYVQESALSTDERQLVDLYRQRKLPQIIMRLVNELVQELLGD